MAEPHDHDELATLDNEFPARSGPYFDIAARGLIPRAARAAIDRMLDDQQTGALDKKAAFILVEDTRRLFAQLVGATPDEIAFTRNITDGIAIFAAALPWQPHDNVVVCDALEHPANLFPWYGLGPKFGVTVKTVPHEAGAVPLDAVLAAIDDRTRVVALASVSFAPGFRAPVAALGRHCRARGILLLIDAAQSIGVLHTDVEALQIDGLTASCQKGLMGLYGLGFLYVRAALAELLHPMALSRFGVDLGDGHEATSGDLANYRLASAARRFDIGNYNFLAVAGAAESLKLLLRIGPQAVEHHVVGLANRFARRMEEAGLPVFGGAGTNDATHIVTIGRSLGDQHDSSANTETAALYDHLVAAGVRLSMRRDLLRFSFGIYNTEAEIDHVVTLSANWLQSRNQIAA